MMDAGKYGIGYYKTPGSHNKWVNKDHIDKAPVWCSVDLRDGNQSLVIPMSLEEKIEYYNMLLLVGFKEIEVSFPAASDTEYNFLRTLIEKNMIPCDVTVQVLTQCREHIIRKTFEACRGIKKAIIHFYNSVSEVQREQVFHKSKEEIKEIAVNAAKLVKRLSEEYDGDFRFEYSPENFMSAEPEYSVYVCNAVLDVLKPSENNNVIINIPVTVEMGMPHVYASHIEYVSENLKYRENVTLSVHPHNDRGTGVADAELAILAGAQRVEGTLFGNGERTGNVDIVTLALNMYSHGIDPGLNFSDIPYLAGKYEKCTGMRVHERTPYSGSLVFAAFSGGHQFAIANGMKYRTENNLYKWTVPYMPIDPQDINRTYGAEDAIRVNAQSGKGGIAYLLERAYGYSIPARMREHFGRLCKSVSECERRELKADDIFKIFKENYFAESKNIRALLSENEADSLIKTYKKCGMDAACSKLKEYAGIKFNLKVYERQQINMARNGESGAAAVYVGIEDESGNISWGVGSAADKQDNDDVADISINALIAAVLNIKKGF